MSQRDLTIRWAIGAGEAKLPLIEKGYIVDDGGAFFGWGVEQGHLGKTEIFCKFNPREEEAAAAVTKWQQEQSKRAFDESYFASLFGPISPEVSKKMSGFNVWWQKIVEAVDPNKVAPQGGPLV